MIYTLLTKEVLKKKGKGGIGHSDFPTIMPLAKYVHNLYKIDLNFVNFIDT